MQKDQRRFAEHDEGGISKFVEFRRKEEPDPEPGLSGHDVLATRARIRGTVNVHEGVLAESHVCLVEASGTHSNRPDEQNHIVHGHERLEAELFTVLHQALAQENGGQVADRSNNGHGPRQELILILVRVIHKPDDALHFLLSRAISGLLEQRLMVARGRCSQRPQFSNQWGLSQNLYLLSHLEQLAI